MSESTETVRSSSQATLLLAALHHSHSIVSSDRNALNSTHKFFLHAMKNRPPNPAEICALESKGEFRRFKICSVAATIGIDWSIFDILLLGLQKDRHGSQEPERHAVSLMP